MSSSFATPEHGHFDIAKPARLVAVGAALSLLAMEAAAESTFAWQGRGYTTKPEVIRHDGDETHSIYVLHGCRQDGRFMAEHLGESFAEIGTTSTIVYPQRGFSVDDIGQTLLEASRGDTRPKSVVAISMGGMALTDLLRDTEFCDEFGEIERVVFDSSPSSVTDLSASTSRAVTAAKLVPYTPSMGRLYNHVVQRSARKHSEVAASDLLREHLYATAGTPFSAVSAQTKFIRTTHFGPDELGHAPVGELFYVSAEQDGVVDPYRAHDGYEKIYGRHIAHIIDQARATPSHAATVESPQQVISILESGAREVTPRYLATA